MAFNSKISKSSLRGDLEVGNSSWRPLISFAKNNILEKKIKPSANLKYEKYIYKRFSALEWGFTVIKSFITLILRYKEFTVFLVVFFVVWVPRRLSNIIRLYVAFLTLLSNNAFSKSFISKLTCFGVPLCDLFTSVSLLSQ